MRYLLAGAKPPVTSDGVGAHECMADIAGGDADSEQGSDLEAHDDVDFGFLVDDGDEDVPPTLESAEDVALEMDVYNEF
ncbi:hypothetical protein A0H81_08792 [Grifola frondosa]|uniref:Uncharacterized protein n=1 Tax=Grifola frondosa TaxID=5627 RepID=A0A1C7M4F8_GRIFR|nr:hypothetical protein A0H81_08792 [Grifola frondosa]